MPDQNMAERLTPSVKRAAQKPMVISMREYRRRELGKKIVKTAAAVVANRAVQAATGASVLGIAGKLAYDNAVVEENQAEKIARFKPTRLFVGTVKFKVNDSWNIRTEPISEPDQSNRVGTILEVGGQPVNKDDVVEAQNIPVFERETRSGIKTTWYQVRDVVRRNLLLRNRIIAYTPLGSGQANGSYYDITGEDEEKYYLKGHEPVRKEQAQIFKVNGK